MALHDAEHGYYTRRNPIGALFREGLAPSTALLWAMNLLNLLSNYLILLWTPAILHDTGVSPSQAIFGTSMYGFGIILGALLTAPVADRLGLERVLTYTVAFGALCVLAIGLLDAQFWLFSVIICGAGMGIGGCQAGIAARESDLVAVLPREIGFRLEMWLVMHEALRANRRPCRLWG